MKTDELIHGLGRDLRPVRRLLSPERRAALWLSFAVVYVTAVVALTWVRRGYLGVDASVPYVLQQLALASIGVLTARASFASVMPGTASRARLTLLPLTGMIAALVWGVLRDVQQLGTLGLGREADWPCVLSTTIGTMLLWGGAAAMLRRGAVLEPRLTATLAGVAAVSLANIEACVSRIHAFTATVIVWHGVTVAVLLLGVVMLGPLVLVRRPLSHAKVQP